MDVDRVTKRAITKIYLGKWSEDGLDHIIREASHIEDAGERINVISGQFLGIPYRESTLIGDVNTPEVFVINLEAMDCFTFVDYVEAMRLSGSFSGFKRNLKRIRYKSGKVAFENRNHFFTDWQVFNKEFINDTTRMIGGHKAKSVQKTLNKREDGTYFLPGIKPKEREFTYLPAEVIDHAAVAKLKTGDYIGIYADTQGLDVSHVGILVRHGDAVYLRHASSTKNQRKVTDQDFKHYITGKPGIIVLRPVNREQYAIDK
jgi:hypothetical protein